MTGYDIAFAVAAGPIVVAAVLAVVAKQVVHAALWLVVALGGLAAAYLVLGADVVALVQLLVYVGAVVVLLLFALMLTRAPIGPREDLDSGPARRLLAALAGGGTTVLLAVVLLAAVGGRTVPVAAPDGAAAAEDGSGAIGGGPVAVGRAIFAGWPAPFELLSLLLLAALVGALAVSGAGRGPDGPDWTAWRRLVRRRPAPARDAEPAAGEESGS